MFYGTRGLDASLIPNYQLHERYISNLGLEVSSLPTMSLENDTGKVMYQRNDDVAHLSHCSLYITYDVHCARETRELKTAVCSPQTSANAWGSHRSKHCNGIDNTRDSMCESCQ